MAEPDFVAVVLEKDSALLRSEIRGGAKLACSVRLLPLGAANRTATTFTPLSQCSRAARARRFSICSTRREDSTFFPPRGPQADKSTPPRFAVFSIAMDRVIEHLELEADGFSGRRVVRDAVFEPAIGAGRELPFEFEFEIEKLARGEDVAGLSCAVDRAVVDAPAFTHRLTRGFLPAVEGLSVEKRLPWVLGGDSRPQTEKL